jgi:folate-binding protein YgfZ
MSKEKSFPIEYGAEQLNAISYTKGCYVGQEVVSRTKYQGVIRKSVMKIEFSYPYIASTDRDIFQNQKKIGHICSSYGVKAIALIRNE